MRNDATFNPFITKNLQQFVYVIDKKKYYFRVTLINPDGDIVDIVKGAVKELKIIDNVFNPFTNGYIIIDNSNEAIERYKTNPIDKELNPSMVPLQGYSVRGDNRDLVLITLYPIYNDNANYSQPSEEVLNVTGNRLSYFLSNEQTVYKDNIPCKKFDLVDADEAILREKKLFFSTTSLITNPDISSLTDDERSVHTGKIIKSMLERGLGDKAVVYTENGQTPYFEDGISSLFYSSPAENTAYDDIMIMLDYHVSDQNSKDFSFLNKDHYTGEYTLESCSSYFKKAYDPSTQSTGKYFLENFSIGGGEDSNYVVKTEKRKPKGAVDFGESSGIINIKFYNPPGAEVQDKIKTTFVHSYNFINKSFMIDSSSGNIENIKESFTTNYVDNMKGKNNSPSPHFIITNNKKQNINYDNVFTVYNVDNDYIKFAVGKNKMLKDALLLNLGIEMVTEGALHRHAGMFISIDRVEDYIDNKFDDKFLGIYFIIEVHHYFDNDNIYRNKIFAVKTYHFSDPKINENVI